MFYYFSNRILSRVLWIIGFQLGVIAFASAPSQTQSEAVHWGYSESPLPSWSYLPKPSVPYERVSSTFETFMPQVEPKLRMRLANHLIKLCVQHSLDPGLVLALIHIESRFKPDVVSHRGAVGLMQLMPETARFIARRMGFNLGTREQAFVTLKDPFINLTLGVGYLSYLRSRYHARPSAVLAAYLMGPRKYEQVRLTRRKDFAQKYGERKWISHEKKLEPVNSRDYINAVVERITKIR